MISGKRSSLEYSVSLRAHSMLFHEAAFPLTTV